MEPPTSREIWPAFCEEHRDASASLWFDSLRSPVLMVSSRYAGDIDALRDALADRDARELRGEPPDASGWTIFEEGGT